jgi:hypothetical protein
MVGEKICTPVGEVHAEDRLEKDHGAYGWQPVMGLTGFAVQVLNGLICPEVLYETEHSDGDQRSLGILDKSAKERQELSDASRNYNICHHPALRKQFEELVRAKPALKAAQAWAQQNARADLLEKIEDWPVMNRAISDKYIKRFIGSELWTDFMHWVDEVDDHDELWYREILRQADLRILLELDPSMINVGLRYILLEYIGRRSRFAIHRCIFRFTDSVPCLAPFLPLLLAKAFDNFRFYDSEDLDCLRRAMMAGTSQDFAALDQIYTKMLRTCSVEQREKLKYYIREFRKTDFQWVQMLRVSGWGKKFY